MASLGVFKVDHIALGGWDSDRDAVDDGHDGFGGQRGNRGYLVARSKKAQIVGDAFWKRMKEILYVGIYRRSSLVWLVNECRERRWSR